MGCHPVPSDRAEGSEMPTAGPSPELRANIISRFSWHWMQALVRLGNKRPLQTADLYDMNAKESTNYCEQRWQKAIEQSTLQSNGIPIGKTPIWGLFLSALGKEFFLASLYKPVWLLAVILQVYVLKALVIGAEKKDKEVHWWWGLLLVLAMLITSITQSITQHTCLTLSQKTGMKVRSTVALAVLDKVLTMKLVVLGETSTGQMLNLVTNDTQKLIDAATYFHFVWFSVVELSVIAAFCIWEAGVSAIPGVVLAFCAQPLQVWMGRSVGRLRRKAVACTDARVRLVGEILTGIRVVKYNGWTSAYLKQVERLRNKEMHWIRKASYLRASTSTIKDAVTPFASLVTFGTYVALHDGQLNPSKAFTILALFSILVRVFSITPTGVQAGGEALVSIQRLRKLLDMPNGDPQANKSEQLRKIYGLDQGSQECKESVAADDCTFSWNLSDTHLEGAENRSFSSKGTQSFRASTLRSSSVQRTVSLRIENEDTRMQQEFQRYVPTTLKDFTLDTINIHVGRGQLVAIVGSVGSGKTSFLLALLGEMHCVTGAYYVEKGVAYVPQQAWIFNGSIKGNILFENEYDEERYRKVLFACALEHDISQLKAGDETEIGERGINLSGGQKARISLARACYSPDNVVFLDDPLAAVDVATARHLMLHVLHGVLKGRTVLLVTHNKPALQLCDQVYLMENGKLKSMVKEDILKHDAVQDPIQAAEQELEVEDNGSPDAKVDVKTLLENGSPKSILDAERSEASTGEGSQAGALTVKEDRAEGVVRLSNYVAYVRGAGLGFCALVAFVFAFAQAVRVMVDYWLSIWVDRKYNLSTHVYVFAYGILATAALILSLARALLFTEAAIKAARRMHVEMAEKVFRSPQVFFDQNSVGRIVNRFSKDQSLVDELLPSTAQLTLENLIGCVGSMVITAVLIPWFIFVLPPFLAGFVLLQRKYVAISRELKRLEGISRSPMYEHFSQTLAGVTSIRAYNVESRFHTRFMELIDANHRAYILFVHAGRWLGVRLDFLASMCVTVAALLVVLLRHNLAPGVAGVVLVQCLQLTGFFQYGVRMAADTENYFTSVERIQTYGSLPSEADPITPPGVITDDWPSCGEIEFINFTMAYRDDLPPVLNSISFKVAAQGKVGILGRTGAGKSSLAAAMFRMVENSSCKGSILIDSVDIKLVGLDDLRQRISIVPQDPVLFRGTVRFNLDPFRRNSDEEINEAIEKVHLKKKIHSLANGLDCMVESNGENFSVGQRQLLCLARAFLRKSRVIVMDEATAAVDGETDKVIHATMRDVFRDCTVMTIAHRLETVIVSDLVLVLGTGGRVAQFDSPANLLRTAQDEETKKESDVTEVKARNLFAEMVSQSGPVVAKQLMEAAQVAEALRIRDGGSKPSW